MVAAAVATPDLLCLPGGAVSTAPPFGMAKDMCDNCGLKHPDIVVDFVIWPKFTGRVDPIELCSSCFTSLKELGAIMAFVFGKRDDGE